MKTLLSLRSLIILALTLTVGFTSPGYAYNVEADSTGNSVYVLLTNDNPGAVFHSITLGASRPDFIANIAIAIMPSTVVGGGSDLMAITFDVNAGAALGSSGDILMTVSGFAAGIPISFDIAVPLEVVLAVAPAQGFVGSTVPAPDPGGVDTDGDGVTDSLETAFGSDPLLANSIPGGDPVPISAIDIPVLPPIAYLFLAFLLAGTGTLLTQPRQR